MTATDYVTVTEVAGDEVTAEQVARFARRYFWAGELAAGKHVLEVACGTAGGVGYLGRLARSVVAGDLSEPLLRRAQAHYGERFGFVRFDAQYLPFDEGSFDVVILFEALYYISDLERFFRECRRVLRPGGMLLISTANKDLYDFNPSPFSHRYLGVVELTRELSAFGFAVECYGDTPVAEVNLRQVLLRPLKAVAARLGLIPKSNEGKKLLKRFVFGRLVRLPDELEAPAGEWARPTPLDPRVPDTAHKVIFCAAKSVS